MAIQIGTPVSPHEWLRVSTHRPEQTSLEGPAERRSSAAHAGDRDAKLEEKSIYDWDISHGSAKRGVQRLTMLPPALGKALGSLVTAPVLAGGYTLGKAGEMVGAGKAVDSPAFQQTLKTFLWSQGIFPTVQYERLGAANQPLARFLNVEAKAEQLEDWVVVEAPCERDLCQTPVVIANHTCYLDGLVLASVLKSPKIVAMAGTQKIPVVGKLMKDMGTIFVERGDVNSRSKTLEAIQDHCAAWRPNDRPLLIFPEGTTSNGEQLLEFRKGAFVAGMPVRPVILVYTGQWDPASTTYRDVGEGPEKVSDGEWATQFIGHVVHTVHVRVLPPYVPSAEEISDPELFARNCHEYMDEAHGRVRDELQRASWKEAAGRQSGGLGYTFGDLSRTACKKVRRRT